MGFNWVWGLNGEDTEKTGEVRKSSQLVLVSHDYHPYLY